MDQQFVAACLAGLEYAVLHIDDVIGVRVVVNKRDGVRTGAGQVARSEIGLVIERLHRIHDFLSRRRTNRGLVVDNP